MAVLSIPNIRMLSASAQREHFSGPASSCTGDLSRACALREDACERLLPRQETPRKTLEDLNDTSIGHVTVLRIFDEYLEG